MPVSVRPYPVNLLVESRPCLVVGGGPVAARKAAELRACAAAVTVVAEVVGDEVRELDGVEWDERPYRPGDVAGYWLVIAATADRLLNAQISAKAEELRVWVNSADDPDNCSFTLPARLHRDPLLVTVSTGGHSPALASWLAGHLGDEIGPEYQALIGILSDERETIRAAGRSTEDLDWQTALDSGMLELVREGHLEEAKERLQACLSSQSA